MLYTPWVVLTPTPSGYRGERTADTKAELDYETKATYMVVVNATDPSGASDSILVTINVTDENDSAVITIIGGETVEPEPEPENNAPAFDSETATLSVDENAPAGGAAVGDPIVATDADEDDTQLQHQRDDSVLRNLAQRSDHRSRRRSHRLRDPDQLHRHRNRLGRHGQRLHRRDH